MNTHTPALAPRDRTIRIYVGDRLFTYKPDVARPRGNTFKSWEKFWNAVTAAQRASGEKDSPIRDVLHVPPGDHDFSPEYWERMALTYQEWALQAMKLAVMLRFQLQRAPKTDG